MHRIRENPQRSNQL